MLNGSRTTWRWLPGFYNSLVDRCLRDGLVPVICHSHPFDGPADYSPSDDFGKKQVLPILEWLLLQQRYASLLLTKTSVAGRILDGRSFRQLRQCNDISNRWLSVSAYKTRTRMQLWSLSRSHFGSSLAGQA